MKAALTILVLLSLAGYGLSLKCATCVAESCDGQSREMQCPSAPGVTATCATYKTKEGLFTKTCGTTTLCDGTLNLGFTDIKCCDSDMCNSSAKLKMNLAITFCLVLLKLFF